MFLPFNYLTILNSDHQLDLFCTITTITNNPTSRPKTKTGGTKAGLLNQTADQCSKELITELTPIQLLFHRAQSPLDSLKCKVIQSALQLAALLISNQRVHHNTQWTTLFQTLELIQMSELLKLVLKELKQARENLLKLILVKKIEVIQLTTVFQASEQIQKSLQVKQILSTPKRK